MRWTVIQVAEALGVPAPAGLDPLAGLAGVSIDSRTIKPGELFIAIRGPRHDGHGFVAGVLAAGAAAGMVASDALGQYPEEIRGKLFVVDDTLVALQRLASAAREIWRKSGASVGKKRQIGAVAGSVGKTTTKEILAALLAARFGVLKTQGNLNNEYGLPLTLLKLDERARRGGGRTGDVPSWRTGAADEDCLAGCGRGYARRRGAFGVFCVGG